MQTELGQVPVWTRYKNYSVTSELFLDLVFNNACNCNCSYCIARTTSFANEDYCAWKNALEETLNTFDVRNIIILGGEATIDKRFFDKVEFLDTLIANKSIDNIILTTNGIMLRNDSFMKQLMSTCINTVNISYMHYDKATNDKIFGADTLSIDEIKRIYSTLKASGKTMRINTNVYRGNLNSVEEMTAFVNTFNGLCDHIKFSPLMDTSMFNTVKSVTDFTVKHAIPDEEIRALYDSLAAKCNILQQAKNILGFVDYSLLDVQGQRVILKYAQVEDKYDRDKIIPTLKLYPNGNLANEWDYRKNII